MSNIAEAKRFGLIQLQALPLPNALPLYLSKCSLAKKDKKMCSYKNSEKYLALAQLRYLLSNHRRLFDTNTTNCSNIIKFLNKLMKCSLDLDYALPSDAPAAQHAPELIGYTALHFAVETCDNFVEEVVDYFIQHGANITAINELSYTPLRLALEKSLRWPLRQISNKELLDVLLNGQYNQNDASNPSCKEGISHLHIACMVDNARMVEYLLRSGASVDAAISKNSQKMAGFRPLHVAVYYCSVDSLRMLLKSGADLYAHEARGLNPLQLLVEGNLKMADVVRDKSDGCGELEDYYLANDEMANLMLEHCADNFYNEYGFDRLHLAASMRDDAKLIELLNSNSGINVNATISTRSPHCPGYTPLHFAAQCGYNAVKLLIEKNANLLIADDQGTTPFDICATKYEPEILYEIMQFDETLKSITFMASPLATLSEAINALQSTEHMDEFLNKIIHIDDQVPFNSPLWPGYTLLHLVVAVGHQKYAYEYQKQLYFEFPAERCLSTESAIFTRKTNMLLYLTEIGANLLAQDVRNSSPVHLAFRRINKFAVTLLLHQLVDKFKQFDNVTDLDGLSLLHISTAGNFYDVVDSLLHNNADVNCCTISEIKFEWNNVKYRFSPNSTPLHFAAANIDSNIISLLIEEGADPLILDADEFTPVFRMFNEVVYLYSMNSNYLQREERIVPKEIIKLLLSQLSASKASAVSIAGLSLLHVACWWDCTIAVKAILNKGADVNAKIISCDLNESSVKCTEGIHRLKVLLLEKYAGYTPLHFAVECKSYDAIHLLMDAGADLHARDARGLSPLHMALMIRCDYEKNATLQSLLANVDKLNCKPIDDYGITLLHVACQCRAADWTRQLLLRGSDVNAQIAMHSPIWPGNTPLHIFTKTLDLHNDRLEMAELLIAHGADLILSNAEKDTPLHILNRWNFNDELRTELYKIYFKNKLKSYNVNPINKEGLSLFHIACQTDNIEMATGLLKQGADINQPVDYFARSIGGLRPLHLASMTDSPLVLHLLINEGADLSAKDIKGWTVIHYFCEFVDFESSMIPTFCKHGVDINAGDLMEISPLKLLLKKYVQDEEEDWPDRLKVYEKKAIHLLNCGARLNRPDFSMFYLANAIIRGLSVDLRIAKDNDILAVMDDGSTAIHNAVYHADFFDLNSQDEIYYYSNFIEKLVERGCSLNAQDNRGRTALHVALDCKNVQGVYSLLEAGIDLNIVDNDFQNHWVPNRVEEIDTILVNYLHKFTLLGLEMSESNHRRYSALKRLVLPSFDSEKMKLKLNAELKEPIGGFLLKEILSEHILSEYAVMSRAKREDILHKLASPEFWYILNGAFRGPIQYQYQRLKERMDLVKSSIDVLAIILGKFLPIECLHRIVSFLSNAEMRILIR